MYILTICNISDKVVCNFLTKWAGDLKIGQNTGYLAYVLMAKSNLTKHTEWTSSQYAIFDIVRMYIFYVLVKFDLAIRT